MKNIKAETDTTLCRFLPLYSSKKMSIYDNVSIIITIILVIWRSVKSRLFHVTCSSKQIITYKLPCRISKILLLPPSYPTALNAEPDSCGGSFKDWILLRDAQYDLEMHMTEIFCVMEST